jgi:hypothetical protein
MELVTRCFEYGNKLYQMNTDKCTHILLCHHFNNIVCHSNMFKHLKGHLQEVFGYYQAA